MRIILFVLGLLFWVVFAYTIENDIDSTTDMWLSLYILNFVKTYVRYKHDMKKLGN